MAQKNTSKTKPQRTIAITVDAAPTLGWRYERQIDVGADGGWTESQRHGQTGEWCEPSPVQVTDADVLWRLVRALTGDEPIGLPGGVGQRRRADLPA